MDWKLSTNLGMELGVDTVRAVLVDDMEAKAVASMFLIPLPFEAVVQVLVFKDDVLRFLGSRLGMRLW